MSSYLSCAVVGDNSSGVAEIGVIEQDWDDWTSLVRFHTYLRPSASVDVPPKALRKWGIRPRHLSEAPTLDDVYDYFCEQLNGPVYGHHIKRQRDALVRAAKSRGVDPQELTSLRWRELSVSRHRAVQGRAPSLRRVCLNLDMKVGTAGTADSDPAATVHRANICRRLHEKLLDGSLEFESTFKEVKPAGSSEVPQTLEDRVGSGSKETPPLKWANTATEKAIRATDGGDLIDFVAPERPFVEEEASRDRQNDQSPVPPRFLSQNGQKADAIENVFLGLNTVKVDDQTAGAAGQHLVVSIGLVSAEGNSLLDTTVRPRSGALFEQGTDALYDRAKQRFVTTSRTGPVTADEIWVAPPFRRIAERLLWHAEGCRVWANQLDTAKPALMHTARAAGKQELASDLESLNWAGLQSWLEEQSTRSLSASLSEGEKGLTELAVDLELGSGEYSNSALQRAVLLQKVHQRIVWQQTHLVEASP